jgi:hypothetical protein
MADIETELLSAERAVLDRWLQADTAAYGRRFDEDATYFDTYAPARIDGRDALERHLGGIAQSMRQLLASRGKQALDRHEMLRPRVQQFGDVAILTYDWVAHFDADSQAWRATVVYRRDGDDWRVAHAHWSVVQPPQGAPG